MNCCRNFKPLKLLENIFRLQWKISNADKMVLIGFHGLIIILGMDWQLDKPEFDSVNWDMKRKKLIDFVWIVNFDNLSVSIICYICR